MKKVTAVVPMKLNNRRLPQKNTKSFTNGKPLCYYILSTLLKIDGIDDVYVYCSNPDIREFIPEGVKYLKRSESLDTDSTKMNDVLKSFAMEVDSDIYVMTHTTAPFVKKESIIKGIQAVLSGEYDSAFAAKKLHDFLWKDNKPFNYELDNIPRTQDLPPIYEETSGFYIYEKDVINKYNRRIGQHPYIVEVGEIEGIDIDELEDFMMQRLGELISYDKENNSDYIDTLETYLDFGGNIGETAEYLYMHRNTIRYRIIRVEEILGIDLNSAGTRFNLRFAFKIRKYLRQSE